MQFLINARIPLLNGLLSHSEQSIVFECLFWMISCTIYSNIFSRMLRRTFRKCSFWSLAKKRGGVFCANGADDSILLLIFACHHVTAGILMFFGTLKNDPILWRHGLLLEMGFEISDLIALACKMYPYRLDGIKSDIKVATVFHHLPGIMLSYFILEFGLHENDHMRAIGMWLLLGAAASSFTGFYIYTLDLNVQLTRVALLYNVTVAFFLYTRYIIFSRESFLFIQDYKALEDCDPFVLNLLYSGFTFLTLFNLAIGADCIPKSVRYIKRALDGVTPIETEPVPPSRDSIYGKRRPSVLAAAHAVGHAANPGHLF